MLQFVQVHVAFFDGCWSVTRNMNEVERGWPARLCTLLCSWRIQADDSQNMYGPSPHKYSRHELCVYTLCSSATMWCFQWTEQAEIYGSSCWG